MLPKLKNTDVPQMLQRSRIPLSPSFYQPATIYEYSSLVSSDSCELVQLSSQFHHFPSWTLLSEYQSHCLNQLTVSTNKQEFLLYTQKRIQANDRLGAISVLESCKHFKWPEVFRILSRLYMNIDLSKSMEYVDTAISLGDSAAFKIKAELLDLCAPNNKAQMSAERVLLVSKLLSKLDPSFASNANILNSDQKSGFLSFITG